MDRNDLYNQFRQLFQEFYDPLCKYACSLTADENSSEDIVQEVFTRIWEKYQDVISSQQIRAYLYKAVRNSCFTFLEQKKRFPTAGISDWDAETTVSADWNTADLPEEGDKNTYRELLKNGIDQLPPKCREVFLLSRSGHLSNQEIADTLGISINTVNNQTWKAMKLLKAFVQKAGVYIMPFFTYFF